MLDMELDVKAAVADIEATPDLLERALRKEVERGRLIVSIRVG